MEAAAETFLAKGGYRRTQMADVARAMGLSPGALYVYVESKEALFDLTVRAMSDSAVLDTIEEFPIPTPPFAETLKYIQDWATKWIDNLKVRKAFDSEGAIGAEELEDIVRDLYRFTIEKRYVIKLVDRSAEEFPELGAVWYRNARFRLVTMLTGILDRGMSEGALRSGVDPAVSARIILENVAVWGMHRHWDPAPTEYDEATIESNVIEFSVAPFRMEKPVSRR